MPFYRVAEMEAIKDSVGPAMEKTVAGEFIKVSFVTYEEGEAPPAHFHPNEEQFILMLEGKIRMMLGDETRTIENGDLVHVPRHIRHGIRVIEGPATFFTLKSPVGDGDISQDYNLADDAEQVAEVLAGAD